MSYDPYNPLDEKNLGASVAEALLEKTPVPMNNIPPFVGAGLYAIYYTGNFPEYAPIAERNRGKKFQWPIYVGKAIPKGARKGGVGLGGAPGPELFNRLQEHKESIELAENLDIADFHCRILVVKDIWIPLGESLLIAKFSPVWNKVVEGFGNHDPGSGRYQGKRPRWDVVHPGRPWAAKCQDRAETQRQILRELSAHLRVASIPVKPKLLIDEDEE